MAWEKCDFLKETLKRIAEKEMTVEEAEGQLDTELGRDCTVMISDFSSFLGMAREKGIIKALSMVERAHVIAEPILSALGGEVLKAEPDLLVVIFSKPIDAVMAARALSRAFEETNNQEGGAQFAICLGIGQGRMLVTENQIFGDQAILAARLGEAVEGSFEIRLTPEAYEGVKHLESLSFSETEPIMVGGVSIAPFKLIFV